MAQYMDQKLLSSTVNNTKGNVPAFLTKLWKIVDDPQYDHLISWNDTGTSIRIHQPVLFSQELLPKFYKHNNFASFVRQVNMYGFRKIVDVASGAKNSDSGDWEFYHQCFQRAHPGNIAMMKRKVQPKEDNVKYNSQLQSLLADVEMLKTQHDIVDDKLKQTLTENERLWGEVFDLRERHAGQQSMIVKLLQFFLQLVMNKPDRNSRKRRYPSQEDAPESIFFQKRALHLPDGKILSKSIQYDSPNISEISGAIDPYLMTNQGKPVVTAVEDRPATHAVSPEAVTETSAVVGDSSGVLQSQDESVKNEGIANVQPCMFFSASPRTAGNPPPPPSRENSNKSTPRATPTSNSKSSSSLPASPFIFPPSYTQPEVSATIDLSSCISTDEDGQGDSNPIIFSAAKSATLHTPDVKSATLHTPEVSNTVIKKTPSKESPPSKELSTPVVTMPTALTRQTSFRDRDELSVNVDNISKSIDMLQEMLNKQEINLDLKSSLGESQKMTSMQELIKLIHQHSDGNIEAEEEEEDDANIDIETVSPAEVNQAATTTDKVVPYTPVFSPSHLMDPEFETVNVEDFDDSSSFFSNIHPVDREVQNGC